MRNSSTSSIEANVVGQGSRQWASLIAPFSYSQYRSRPEVGAKNISPLARIRREEISSECANLGDLVARVVCSAEG